MSRGMALATPLALVIVDADELGSALVDAADESGDALDLRSVSSDMRVWQVAGMSREAFAFRLYRKPWPKVGQRVSFAFERTRFVGDVTKTTQSAMNSHGTRWACDVEGDVIEFEALDCFEE